MAPFTAARFIKPITSNSIHDFQGHTSGVSSVAFSPNGQYALTGSRDKTAKLWNFKDGTLIHTFQGHTSDVLSVAFSPNGQYALTGSYDKTAKLWNVKDETLKHTFQGHTGFVFSAAFSPNGQYALTGSWDNTAKLWNVKDGTLIHTFQGHISSVWSVAFSPNGQYALTGSDDKTAKLWNVKDGTLIHTFQGHTDFVRSVAFSPNGQYALTGSSDKTAKLWNVKDGTLIHTFQGHTDFVRSIAFSPNGQYALTGSYDKTAKLWNVKDGTLIHTFQGHRNIVESVAFSPNGQYALTGSYDKTAKLWNVKDGTLIHTFQGHTDFVWSVAFSPNGQYALTGSWDKTAKLWQLPESAVASVIHPESVGPLTTSNFDTKLHQTNQKNPSFSTSSSNDVNFMSTSASIPGTNETNNVPMKSYNPIDVELLDKLNQQGDHFLNIINNAAAVESGVHLLSQYPEELQSLLYEKSQSELERKELKAILRSQEHHQFYIHFIRKLQGMMMACETINSGMVSQADVSFQDYVHGLVKEGAWTALQQIGLGRVLGGVIEWAKKQFASVPFTDAIGSFFKMACEFKSKRDQHLAIGRVAIMSALADMQEHDSGGMKGMVHRIGRCIVRAESEQLSSLESVKFGRVKDLWTKANGESANTPAKELGCNAADMVIGVIMKPTKNTDLYNILEGHIINQSAPLGEIIVAAALDMPIEDVQRLEWFTFREDNMEASNNNPTNVPAKQYSGNVEASKILGVAAAENNVPNHPGIGVSASEAASKDEFQRMRKAMEELQKQNELFAKELSKLKSEKKGREVDVGSGLAQEYVNPHETSGQETSTTKRMGHFDKRLAVVETNLLEANRIVVEHEERLGVGSETKNGRKKGFFSRRAKEKQKLKKMEEKRQKGELFNMK